MKKFLVVLLALTFVFGLSTFVVADDKGVGIADNGAFTISGDARVRGTFNQGYTANGTAGNFNDKTDADDKYYDQRLRLKITGMVGDGIEVRTRLNMGDGQFGNQSSVHNDSVDVDYFYLHIPVGSVVIDAGNMTRNWSQLLLWDVEFDTVQVTTNVGDTQLGVYTDKVTDTRATAGTENLEDYDNYGIFAIHNTDNLTAGLIIIREDDDRLVADTSGTEFSAYVKASVGAISLGAEFARKSGDMNEITGKKPAAAVISASTDVGAINLTLIGALAKNGFVADNDLHPSVFFGTAHPTAIADFQAAADSTSKALGLTASTDISSDLSAYGTLFWADLQNLGSELGGSNCGALGTTACADTGQEEVTEIDLGIAYKLSSNATYYIDFGYLMPDNITTQDDNAVALAHKIQVYF